MGSRYEKEGELGQYEGARNFVLVIFIRNDLFFYA